MAPADSAGAGYSGIVVSACLGERFPDVDARIINKDMNRAERVRDLALHATDLVFARNVGLKRACIGSGAGLLAESRLEREFDELREKREQVKSLFGLTAPVAV